MESPEVLSRLQKQLGDTADVHRVFGDPIVVGERTIIPVARISAGFGGGSGHKSGSDKTASGGGGGLEARPIGAVEVSRSGTRYIPIYDPGALVSVARAAVMGLLLGLAFRRRR